MILYFLNQIAYRWQAILLPLNRVFFLLYLLLSNSRVQNLKSVFKQNLYAFFFLQNFLITSLVLLTLFYTFIFLQQIINYLIICDSNTLNKQLIIFFNILNNSSIFFLHDFFLFLNMLLILCSFYTIH